MPPLRRQQVERLRLGHGPQETVDVRLDQASGHPLHSGSAALPVTSAPSPPSFTCFRGPFASSRPSVPGRSRAARPAPPYASDSSFRGRGILDALEHRAPDLRDRIVTMLSVDRLVGPTGAPLLQGLRS
jgi:hypothetical protein